MGQGSNPEPAQVAYSGEADGVGDLPTKEPEAPADPVLEGDQSLALHWEFPCDAETESSFTQTDDKISMTGAEHFAFPLQKYDHYSLVSSGQVCLPSEKPRDILFIVDVSGSMKSDEAVNGSCYRSRAMEAIFENLASSANNRYALLTFHAQVEANSGGFYASKDALFQQIGASPVDTLCPWLADTNYTAAFSAAEMVMAQSRSNANLEIYFISDGGPSGDASTGPAIAQKMKDQGFLIDGLIKTVRISTMMIGGENGVMKMIASKKVGGEPYYLESQNFDQIEASLLQFLSPGIKDIALSYKSDNQAAWQKIPLTLDPKTFRFSTESVDLPLENDKSDQALWLKLNYIDNQDHESQLTGSLGTLSDSAEDRVIWLPAPGLYPISDVLKSKGDFLDYSTGNRFDPNSLLDLDFKAHAAPRQDTFFLDGIDAGEWVRFPLQVAKDGLYTLHASVATAATARQRAMHFEVNRQILRSQSGEATILIPQGSGAEMWFSVSLNQVALKAGRQYLDVYFDTNGFSIESLEIVGE